MKIVALFSVLLIAANSSAKSEAEYLYGGNAEQALEACLGSIDKKIEDYIKANNDLPVIDVGKLKADYEEECRALAERELQESEAGNHYESQIQELDEHDSISIMELFSDYSITPNELINFYVDDKTSFIVVSGIGMVATLSLIRSWDRLTMGGGKGKYLKAIALSLMGVSAATSASAYEIQPGDFDFNRLRSQLTTLYNSDESTLAREQLLLEPLLLRNLNSYCKPRVRFQDNNRSSSPTNVQPSQDANRHNQ